MNLNGSMMAEFSVGVTSSYLDETDVLV